jgi:hypothetical protein
MTGDSDRASLEPAAQTAPPRANAELIALAETLKELPLTDVEPVLGAPRWR